MKSPNVLNKMASLLEGRTETHEEVVQMLNEVFVELRKAVRNFRDSRSGVAPIEDALNKLTPSPAKQQFAKTILEVTRERSPTELAETFRGRLSLLLLCPQHIGDALQTNGELDISYREGQYKVFRCAPRQNRPKFRSEKRNAPRPVARHTARRSTEILPMQDVISQAKSRVMAPGVKLPGGNSYLKAVQATPEVKTPEAKAPEAKAPEVKTPEAKAPEANTPEAKQVKAPEANAPEAKQANTPEAKAPEANAPEANAPEAKQAKSPEVKAPEVKAPEEKSPEVKLPQAKSVKPVKARPEVKSVKSAKPITDLPEPYKKAWGDEDSD